MFTKQLFWDEETPLYVPKMSTDHFLTHLINLPISQTRSQLLPQPDTKIKFSLSDLIRPINKYARFPPAW